VFSIEDCAKNAELYKSVPGTLMIANKPVVVTKEIIHRRGPWKSREAVELATLEWVSWFNNHRLLEPIGYIPPAEAEVSYWRQHGQASSTTKLAAQAAPQEG
jgi:transposase InsO family protein